MMNETSRRTHPLQVAAAWMVVAIPLAWGVCQTAIKSAPLFGASEPVAVPAPSPARSQVPEPNPGRSTKTDRPPAQMG